MTPVYPTTIHIDIDMKCRIPTSYLDRTTRAIQTFSTTRAYNIGTINSYIDAGYGAQRRWNGTSQFCIIIQTQVTESRQIS